MSAKGVIIGFGHPRTGTTSLASLLDMQQWFTVTHEHQIRLPWENAETYLLMNFNNIYMYPSLIVGDIGFYYLNYIEKLHKMYPMIKFVCMKRDKDDTIKSLRNMTNKFKTNHLVDRKSKHWNNDWNITSEEAVMYRNCFPKYYNNVNTSFSKYYDQYYKRVDKLKQIIPKEQLIICDMNTTFNTEQGQIDLLKGFFGLENPIYSIGIRVFKTGEAENGSKG